VPELAQYLLPSIGKADFNRMFGNPYRKNPSCPKPKTIERYVRHLEDLSAQGVSLSVPANRSDTNHSNSSQLAELLQLQQLIGGLR
jgi:hypothetical protein